jgi:uroporphyrinogen decarboxylase
MTSLERVVCALNHKEADYVPVYPLINSISRRYMDINYAEWTKDIEKCTASIIKATDDLDVDVICTIQDLSVEAADFGQSIIYPPHVAAHPDMKDYIIKDIADYKKVQPVNPRTSPRMGGQIRMCDALMKAMGKEKPVVAFVFGPLGILSMMRGQADLFIDCADGPEALHSALEAITDTLMEYCKAIIETGTHAIMLDTLFASQSIMSKAMWMELEGKYVRRLADFIHSQNTLVMIHNCGNGIYFDVQIETMRPQAISFLYPPDDCKDFFETKAKYGRQTTLIGALTPSWIMSATREEIEDECRKEIDAMAKGGGFILATGCEYPSNADLDGARIMVEMAKTYGRYKK